MVWIANAAVRGTGADGAITHPAQQAAWSRQTVYDQAQKVHGAVEAHYVGGPTRADLIPQNHRLRHEHAPLWDWLRHTIEFPPCKHQEFSVTARARGLSLNQTLVLRTLLRGTRARPGRCTIPRGIKAAGPTAAKVLRRLDLACQAVVLGGGLDEIFFPRRPVLVGVEPASRVWFLGRRASDRQDATWCQELQGGTSLQDVVTEAGRGLPAGIALVQQQRRASKPAPLENGWDIVHTAPEARRVLGLSGNRVERLWEQAETATRQVAQAHQQGRDARGGAAVARSSWKKAAAAFPRFEESEAGWRIAHAALQGFGPEGHLTERPWATGQSASALPTLAGREWSQVRGFLQAEETFPFRDRRHRQLGEAEPAEERRGELGRWWWLRRPRPRGASSDPRAGSGHGGPLVQLVVCHQREANWGESYPRGAGVLRQTVRASRAVEGLNSVLRMHQARHRTVTPELLDLKRLSWNCRVFREGKRRGRCPYEHLGLKLPRYRFWDLLGIPTPTAEAT